MEGLYESLLPSLLQPVMHIDSTEAHPVLTPEPQTRGG